MIAVARQIKYTGHDFSICNVTNHNLVYVRIWKNGNDEISFVLNNLIRAVNGLNWNGHLVPRANSHYSAYLTAINDTAAGEATIFTRMKEYNKDVKLNVFTFLRDPYSRFLSGMSEIVEREEDQDQQIPVVEKFDVDDAKVFFRDLLSCQLKGRFDTDLIAHISPQMRFLQSSLFGNETLYIGQVEHMVDDFATIMTKIGIPEKYRSMDPDHHLNGHVATRSDKLHVRESFRDLFVKEPQYLRALCWLLIPDYICIPVYQVPAACMQVMWKLDRSIFFSHKIE